MRLYRGGMTHLEEQAQLAMNRLTLDHERHTVAKLPCCGSSVEVTDPYNDTFVVCPNVNCRKRHVVMAGLKHQIKSEVSNAEPSRNLIW